MVQYTPSVGFHLMSLKRESPAKTYFDLPVEAPSPSLL